MWPHRDIESLCTTITSGGTPKRSDPSNYDPGTIPWIKTAELQDAEIVSSEERISQFGLAHSSAKILPPSTVLMAMYGATVGKLGITQFEMTCNQASCAMITDPARTSARWLFYSLLRNRADLVGLANGAAQQNLSARTIRHFQIPVPPLSEQKAIAEVLGALDDKISANRRLVTTINELASVEYKKSAVTERTLTDLASFVNGRNFTKNATGDGRVVVRIAELNSGIGGSTVRNQVEDAADDNLVRPGDILFAWSGSLTVHRWTQPEALINQHIFKVIPNDDVPYWLAYQAVKEKLPEFKSIAADKATTMGHIQRRHLDTAVMVPSPDKISEIDPLMSSLWKRAITADEESRTLASLRDTLLPALMDGTIRVKDAEKQTEEVL